MRHHPLNAVLVLVAVASLIGLSPGTAQAEPRCEYFDPEKGVCTVGVETPAIPSPGGGTVEGAPAAAEGGPVLPCWQDMSAFTRLDPQPPAGDPVWHGRDPADGGAIYHCHVPALGDSALAPIYPVDMYFWFSEPPGSGSSGITPPEVAQIAVDSMDLVAIDIGIVPEPRAGYVGIVGMPVWMWAANPGPTTVGPVSASASAGGITVNATAHLQQVTWSMGDGTVVTCDGAGTPYVESYGDARSPSCGHVYTTTSASEPGETFTVTATSDWVISWEGAGQTGTIRLDDLQRSVQVAVGEAQVLVTR